MTTRRRPTPDGPGVIASGQLYTLSEAERRLGWGRKTTVHAVKDGLKVIWYGRSKYVLGSSVLEWFAALESKPDGPPESVEE